MLKEMINIKFSHGCLSINNYIQTISKRSLWRNIHNRFFLFIVLCIDMSILEIFLKIVIHCVIRISV
jgi:hypothetical protein